MNESTLTRSSTEHGQQQEPQTQRRNIISEETYTGVLKNIITRDFFPSIPSLKRDAAVLQKRSEGDVAGAVAIRRAARKVALNEELLQKAEEMEEFLAVTGNGSIRKRPRPLDRETVDGFHARVTSEDNAEFEVNMKKEAIDKREKMDIVYNSTGSDYKNVKYLLSNDCQMIETTKRTCTDTPLMASDEFNAPAYRIQAAGTTKDGKHISDRNSFFFTPSHYASPTRPSASAPLSEKIENIEDGDSYNNSLELMPPPSKHPLITKNSLPETPMKCQLVEYQAKPSSSIESSSSEKQTIPSNTRFAYQNESRIVASTTSQRVKPLSNYKQQYRPHESDTTDLDESPLPLEVERRERLRKLENDRDTFVTMTPLIIPGSGEGVEDSGWDCEDNNSPIITWGTHASTPLVIGADRENSPLSHDQLTNSETTYSSSRYYTRNREVSNLDNEFRLPKEDDYERVAKVAEAKLAKQAKKYKQRDETKLAGQGTKDRKHSTLFDRTKSLTPAARSLLERSTSSNIFSNVQHTPKFGARSGSAFGSAIRNSYTPKVKKRSASSLSSPTFTPLGSRMGSSTRKLKANNGNDKVPGSISSKSTHKGSGTGGLLKID